MEFLVAIILFILVYGGLAHIVFRLRPSSSLVAILFAFPLFICLETVILNFLSLFNGVNRLGVILAHVVFLVGLAGSAGWSMFRCRGFRSSLYGRLARRIKLILVSAPNVLILLVPLLLIVTLTTFLYVPNTYDSMTYHMARVAHWMQQGSIDYYTTNIRRQNEMGPGAEYVILFFQIITRSDRLANGVQWIAFLLIPLALYYVSRVLKIARPMISWIIVLCMTMPMAVLQASSTQNDIVDSVVTLCIIVSIGRLYLGNVTRLQTGEVVLISLCVAAGYLVKPISLIVALPFFLLGFISHPKQVAGFVTSRRGGISILITFFILLLICGPDVGRKLNDGVFSRPEVWPLFSDWSLKRLYNPIAIIAPNFPFPDFFRLMVKQVASLPIDLYDKNVFNIHEDFIGNPHQVLVLLLPAFLAMSLLPFYSAAGRSKNDLRLLLLAMIPVISWCFFGWTIKNQAWITRLQLPLFFLLPFSLAFLFSTQIRYPIDKIVKLLFIGFVVFSYSYGMKVVSMNPSRPLEARFFWGRVPSAYENYYRNFDRKKVHNNFLQSAREMNCDRAYMLVTPDYGEYPLTWRSMQQGIEMRHSFPNLLDGWACMLFADGVKHKYVPDRGTRWINHGDSHTLMLNPAHDFNRSLKRQVLISDWSDYSDLRPSRKTVVSNYGTHLTIKAEDKDPYIILPELSLEKDQSSVIKISLYSPNKTMAKLYYLANDLGVYSEKQMYKKGIDQGENEIYFQIYGDEISGRLRFDPGAEVGEYVLHSVEIRTI